MYFVAGPATARQVSVTCRDSKDVMPKPSSLPSFLRRLSDCLGFATAIWSGQVVRHMLLKLGHRDFEYEIKCAVRMRPRPLWM
jgi:hypothetical protein